MVLPLAAGSMMKGSVAVPSMLALATKIVPIFVERLAMLAPTVAVKSNRSTLTLAPGIASVTCGVAPALFLNLPAAVSAVTNVAPVASVTSTL